MINRPVQQVNDKLKRLNYKYELLARKHSVSGIPIKSYDPIIPSDELRQQLIERVKSNSVVYDVGAHAGRYSLPAAKVASDVVAFEPNPLSFEWLNKNIDENDFTNILPQNVGVGAQSDTMTFYISSQRPRSSFKRKHAETNDARVVNKIDVNVVPLDEFVKKHPTPDHVKIDVEGYGMEVFSGATRTVQEAQPVIYFEPHLIGDTAKEERRWLKDQGYEINELGYGWVCIPFNEG